MKKLLYSFLLGLSLIAGQLLQAQDYKLPPYQKFQLKNGLTVYLMEQHEVPKISVSVVLPAGAIYDGQKAGLASLTATALRHGTRNYPKTKLDETLDFIGAGVNTYASKESAGLSASFAAKDKEVVLPIIVELLTAPSFDSTEFVKEKRDCWYDSSRLRKAPALSLVHSSTNSFTAIMCTAISSAAQSAQ